MNRQGFTTMLIVLILLVSSTAPLLAAPPQETTWEVFGYVFCSGQTATPATGANLQFARYSGGITTVNVSADGSFDVLLPQAKYSLYVNNGFNRVLVVNRIIYMQFAIRCGAAA